MTKYTLTVQEDPETGDAILEFPDSLMEEANWKEGDTIEWIDNGNGSWHLRKIVPTSDGVEHTEQYFDTERNR